VTQDEINEYKYKMEINKFIRQVMEGKKPSELEGVLYYQDQIIEIAKLVVKKEREKTLQLWMLLDDVDTADDIAKSNDDVYRSLCRQAHAKRWAVLTGDEVDAEIRARGQE